MRESLAVRRLLACALACAACVPAGCGTRSAEVTGSPELPAQFGRIKDARGCPDLAGLYAWPPSEGSAYGYGADGRPEQGYRGGFLGLPVRGDAQVWIAETPEGAGRLALHARPAAVATPGGDRPTAEWTAREPRYDCARGWARVHRELVNTPNPHGSVRAEARLAVLADGALAVGQATTVPQAPIALAVSGFEFFSIARPDRTVWSWSKLARIGDTGDAAATAAAAAYPDAARPR